MYFANKQMIKILLLFGIALCWAPSFLFIKIAIGEIGPLTIVAARVVLAAVILYCILRFRGIRLWSHRNLIGKFVFLGFFSCALPFFLISVGEKYISSGLAAIINGTTPIFTVLLAHFATKTDKLTSAKIMGIIFGFLGLLIIFVPSLEDNLHGNETGIFLVLLAALSYGVGMVYSKNNLAGLPGLVAPTAQMITASCMTIPLAIFLEKPYLSELPSMSAVFSILGLAVFGTALAFVFYFKIIEVAGATYLSTSAMLFPVFSVFLGAVFLGEVLGFNVYLGFILILCGLFVSNGMYKAVKAKFQRSLF